MEHGWLVEVAESSEVILAHQDVRVPQVRQVLRLGVQLVINGLDGQKNKCLKLPHKKNNTGISIYQCIAML